MLNWNEETVTALKSAPVPATGITLIDNGLREATGVFGDLDATKRVISLRSRSNNGEH